MNGPNQNPTIGGIHHITAVTGSAMQNYRFYTQVLGLRLVKKTVNFDDPFTYHLYYGDETGHPGTILTFFPWEQLPQGEPGAGMVSAVAFAVPKPSIDHWRHHLDENRIAVETAERFGEAVLRFADPHGLPLELIGTPQQSVPDGHAPGSATAIIGFHSATLLLNRIEATQTIIVEGMGMTLDRREGGRYRFAMQDRHAPGHLIDIHVDPSARQGRPGSGTVHHIAFRTRNSREQRLWRRRLQQYRLSVTDVRDRKYFRSIYFHEPGGVLFEIATDPPGFAVDESPRRLGRALKLPQPYEHLRKRIEKQLPPLESPNFQHIYAPAEQGTDDGRTIVALHGTGGSEHDLLPVVRQINSSAPIISPRGRVLENGMPRFFKRLASGVFDEDDVRQRAHELADFLSDAAGRYHRSVDRLVALGYSNGANIAAAILMLRPQTFNSAILLRPMLPLQTDTAAHLRGMPVLITRGKFDRVIPAESTDRLAKRLSGSGAQVTVVEINAGHELTQGDLESVRAWLSETQPTAAAANISAANKAA